MPKPREECTSEALAPLGNKLCCHDMRPLFRADARNNTTSGNFYKFCRSVAQHLAYGYMLLRRKKNVQVRVRVRVRVQLSRIFCGCCLTSTYRPRKFCLFFQTSVSVPGTAAVSCKVVLCRAHTRGVFLGTTRTGTCESSAKLVRVRVRVNEIQSLTSESDVLSQYEILSAQGTRRLKRLSPCESPGYQKRKRLSPSESQGYQKLK